MTSRARYARGLRWTIFALTIVLAGFSSGRRVYGKGRCAAVNASDPKPAHHGRLPEIANALADGMAWSATSKPLCPAKPIRTNWTQSSRPSARRTMGVACAAVPPATRRAHRSRHHQQQAKLEQSTLARALQLKGGLGEKLLHQFLHGRTTALITKAGLQQTAKLGRPTGCITPSGKKLTPEAALAGNPESITRSELSRFLIRDGIGPGILNPIHFIARSQQFRCSASAC